MAETCKDYLYVQVSKSKNIFLIIRSFAWLKISKKNSNMLFCKIPHLFCQPRKSQRERELDREREREGMICLEVKGKFST